MIELRAIRLLLVVDCDIVLNNILLNYTKIVDFSCYSKGFITFLPNISI